MRVLSAIVLILWTACFGRCLAGQCGLMGFAQQQCSQEDQCCDEEDGNEPKTPTSPCEVCEFVKSGGTLLSAPLTLAAVEWFLIADILPVWLSESEIMVRPPDDGVAQLDTAPRGGPRMCEWMASMATPVRGPNAGA